MDIFKLFATDEVAEVEGRWFPMGAKAEVFVARTGTPAYNKALRQRMKDAQVNLDDSSDENEALVAKLVTETMAECVLKGWKGLQYQGQDIAYSTSNASKLLALKEFRKRIGAIADNMESFRLKEDEAQGND